MQPPSSPSRLYGRRKGRPLRVRKAQLMQELLPQLVIAPVAGTQKTPQGYFENPYAKACVEIGFGGGEHLAAQAKRNPDTCFIGCEPFENGVASLLDHLERDKIQNVRVFNNDARIMLDALTDASLDRCFILFADPWPKKRHAERRFVGQENLVRLARVLKPGGLLRVASDHPQLVEWSRDCLRAHEAFACVHDSAEPPPDWVQTRYQEKAVEAGRPCIFMDWRKK